MRSCLVLRSMRQTSITEPGRRKPPPVPSQLKFIRYGAAPESAATLGSLRQRVKATSAADRLANAPQRRIALKRHTDLPPPIIIGFHQAVVLTGIVFVQLAQVFLLTFDRRFTLFSNPL